MKDLPYRRNVAAIIFNPQGKIFIALRHDLAKEGIWSFPQGGIDHDENPKEAIKRELSEEIGSNQIEILEEYPEWITYDFPLDIMNNPLKGKFKGQTQKWFAVRFIGQDADINLDNEIEKEFDEWKWINICDLPKFNTGYKQEIYHKISEYFTKYTRS